jgi:exonuclease VII large subunit
LVGASAALGHRVALHRSALSTSLALIRARDWRERGFALVRRRDGSLVDDAAYLAPGVHVTIQMKGGTLDASIDAIAPDETENDA